LLHELDAHDGVFVEESTRVFSIRTDAAYDCRQMDHQLWTPVIEGAPDAVVRPKVVIVGSRDKDLVRPGFGKASYESLPEEPSSTCDHNAPPRPEVTHLSAPAIHAHAPSDPRFVEVVLQH